jgi:transcriptional regulator GlxA family with amidase domain
MKRIGFVLAPEFQMMSLGALSVFEFVNVTLGKPLYDVRVLSEHGGLVLSSTRLGVMTEKLDGSRFDTFVVGGGTEVQVISPGIIKFLKQALKRSRRVTSICTGAIALAEAGLLDGRKATTHWSITRHLQERFPKVEVIEDRIYINDGPIWTSAGMTAGVDLALALVEADHGLSTSRLIARKLVVYHRRAGGQSQFSTLLELAPKSDRIQNALTYAKRHLQSALTIDELAKAANLSPRQFFRAFVAETGRSPAKAIEQLRVEAARIMMEDGVHSADVIARETGFGARERMRRAFLRAFGQPPQVIRRSSRIDVAA